jgi:hypothetical protein
MDDGDRHDEVGLLEPEGDEGTHAEDEQGVQGDGRQERQADAAALTHRSRSPRA